MGRSALDILAGTFGVQSITATDPGIQKLAAIRSGEYAGVGTVNISAQSQVNQILGIEQDKLAVLARSGALDPSDKLLDIGVPLSVALFGAVTGGAGAIAVKAGSTYVAQQNQESEFTPSQSTGGRKMAFQDGDTSFFPDFNLNSILQLSLIHI